MSKLSKKNIAVIVLLVLLLISITNYSYIRLGHLNYKYIEYAVYSSDYTLLGLNINGNRLTIAPEYEWSRPRKELRAAIEKETTKFYFYKETNKFASQQQLGTSNLFFNIVTIRTGLSDVDYTISLTHELCHIKYHIGNEIYTSYKTFITLWESDNPYLHDAGKVYAVRVLAGKELKEYDCGYYILNYLRA